jgi:hypothetical protein
MAWTAFSGAVTLIAGTSLNSLANGGWVTGATVDNSTDKTEMMDIAVRLSSAITPFGAGARIDVYLIPDANPDDIGGIFANSRADVSADTPAQYKVGEIPGMAVASSFQRGVLRGVVIPPGRFKIQLENNLGVAFPSNDNNACEGFKYGPA